MKMYSVCESTNNTQALFTKMWFVHFDIPFSFWNETTIITAPISTNFMLAALFLTFPWLSIIHVIFWLYETQNNYKKSSLFHIVLYTTHLYWSSVNSDVINARCTRNPYAMCFSNSYIHISTFHSILKYDHNNQRKHNSSPSAILNNAFGWL